MSVHISAPTALDVTSVLEAAFAVRDTDPAYFSLWLAQAYTEVDGWHEQDPDPDRWIHHASALGECARRYVLQRSGVEREPLSVQSLTTFEIGKHIHVLLQVGLAVHPDYTLLGHEIGGVAERDSIRLAARADAVYLDPSGACCLFDLKSEKDYAIDYRRKEAEAAGRTHTAKPEHELQVRATAAVVHRLTEHRPLWAWVIYWSKDSGRLDPQPIRLGSQPVVSALDARESAWENFALLGSLPPRLATWPRKGLCQPRSDDDTRGRYCPVRSYCATAPTP